MKKYTTEKGETMNIIAEKFGVIADEIKDANPFVRRGAGQVIAEGTELDIPEKETPAAEPAEPIAVANGRVRTPNGGNLNVRRAPEDGAEIVGGIPDGTEIIFGDAENGFVFVPQYSAYVKEEFVIPV